MTKLSSSRGKTLPLKPPVAAQEGSVALHFLLFQPERLVLPNEPVGDHKTLTLHLHLSPLLNLKTFDLLETVSRVAAEVDLARLPVRLHPAGGVDGVPKETVARHLDAHNSSHAGPGVETNPDPQLVPGSVLDSEHHHFVQYGEAHPRNLRGVVVASVPVVEPGHHHVGVTDGLHFVDVVVLDDGVETRVEVIEKIHNLHGRALSRDGGETNNVTEVYCDGWEGLGHNCFLMTTLGVNCINY